MNTTRTVFKVKGEPQGAIVSSIIIVSVPVHGHVTPLLTVAENFVKRGDTCDSSPVRASPTGRRHGCVICTTADRGRLRRPAILGSFPERAGLKGAKAIAFDIEHVFARPAKAQYETLMAALAAHPADAVLAEPLFLGAVFLLATRVQRVRRSSFAGSLPLPVESRDTAPFGMGLPPARLLNRPRNIALAALNRQVLRRPYRVIDDLHREVHGTAMPGTFVDWGRRADAIVQFTVPRSNTPGPMRPPRCTSSGRCRPPARRLRYRHGGPISTGPVPSSTSLRARLPTPTTGKPSRPRCMRLPETMFSSWSQQAVAHWTRCPRSRQRPRSDLPALRRIAAAH